MLVLLTAAAFLLYRPFYRRVYTGDRIKGKVSITVDGEAYFSDMSDISGCDKWNVSGGDISLAIKGGEYGKYSCQVIVPKIDKAVSICIYQFNWWNVTEFDLDIAVDAKLELERTRGMGKGRAAS